MASFGSLTTRERYGVRLGLQLAKTFQGKTPISLAEISKREDISMKYLEQLIMPFKKEKWVESIRGRDGGYIMKKDPKKLTLKDMMLVIDGELEIIKCLKKGHHCKLHKSCGAKEGWVKVQKAIFDSLDSIRISDLIK